MVSQGITMELEAIMYNFEQLDPVVPAKRHYERLGKNEIVLPKFDPSDELYQLSTWFLLHHRLQDEHEVEKPCCSRKERVISFQNIISKAFEFDERLNLSKVFEGRSTRQNPSTTSSYSQDERSVTSF
jgi:hypothetical protein